ncbi:helix-turn-helix domain-containing protein [Amycolatopsis thailandensis]|uniref:helix-turn-helix domain-containing protein n=1 Tax=Amycolatopsis thailandensis TaxID=589330 RepID=UPI0037AA1CB4
MNTVIDWWTPAQVATEVKCHVTTVWLALESGELHGHQRMRGGRWKVHPDAVDAWIRGMDGVAACGCARLRPVGRRAA